MDSTLSLDPGHRVCSRVISQNERDSGLWVGEFDVNDTRWDRDRTVRIATCSRAVIPPTNGVS